MKNKLTKEDFELIVRNCLSIADICRALHLVPIGGNYKTIKNKLNKWNINTEHFTGRGWNTGNRFRKFNFKIELIDILVENSTYTSTNRLKNRLIVEGIKENKCEICGIDSWMGINLRLELHHINGNNCDNRIENLIIVCPNCHSQTETYRGKNIVKNNVDIKHNTDNNKPKIRKIYNCTCGAIIKRGSKQCTKCYQLSQRKFERPSHEQLKLDVDSLGYLGTGRKYGVSDNAIRKWLNT